MKNQVIEAIDKNKIVAILRNIDSDKLVDTVQALYEGGIRLVEVTYSADGTVSDEETAANIRLLSEKFKDRMFVGAGTVLTPEQVKLTAKNGGTFIISPDTNKEVIEMTKKLSLVSMPGALTPSEITAAHRYGADYIKLFPITNMGPEYVKAIAAPLSHIKFIAVGGIDQNNMADYLKAGVCGFGIGSNITNKKMIAEKNYEALTNLAKEYVEVIEK